MNELKVIDNELVPVYVTSIGEKVVYGSELYEVLEVKSKFADWVKNRLNDCEALENEEFEAFSKNLESGGRSIEYIIKLDTAKEMAMLERNEKGKQVRRYFIQVEKKCKEKSAIPMSTSGQIHLLAQGYTELEQKVDTVEQKIGHLENTMNIDYAQQKQLKDFVNEVVVNSLGGRDSKAYTHQDEKGVKMRPRVYSRLWHDFYDYFNINAYANLPRVKFDEALQYINRWQPPTNMQLEIGRINREVA